LRASRPAYRQYRRHEGSKKNHREQNERHAAAQSARCYPDRNIEVVSAFSRVANDLALAQTPPREPLVIHPNLFRRSRLFWGQRACAFECRDNVSFFGDEDGDGCAHEHSISAMSASADGIDVLAPRPVMTSSRPSEQRVPIIGWAIE